MEISMKLPNQNIKVPRILPKAAAESLDVLWGIPRSEQEQEHKEYEQAQVQEYLHNQHQNSQRFHDWLIQSQQQQFSGGINPQDLITERIHRKTQTQTPQNQTPQTPELSPSNSTSSNPMSGESLRVLKSKKLTNNHKGRYVFKSDGFIKKTISIQLEGHTHHLVAYYSLEDFCRGHLQLNEALQGNDLEIITEESTGTDVNLNEIKEHSITDSDNYLKELPFDPQLMEILRQVPIPVDLMLQQNFRKPAALLASATSTAQGFLAANPGNGEKLITALEYGAINPSDLQQGQNQINSQNLIRKPTGNPSSGGFVRNGGIIFSSSSSESFNCKNKTTNTSTTSSNSKLFNPRPRRHSSFHPNDVEIGIEETLTNLLDESSQLSGEALEFLSHFSDETPENLDYSFDPSGNITNNSENINFSNISGILIDNNQLVVDLENDLNNQSSENSDLGAELFGSILSSNDEGNYSNPNHNVNNNSCVIRGEDVMLSDAPKD